MVVVVSMFLRRGWKSPGAHGWSNSRGDLGGGDPHVVQKLLASSFAVATQDDEKVRVEASIINTYQRHADVAILDMGSILQHTHGSIDFPEFLMLVAHRFKPSTTEDMLSDAFQFRDQDGDGFINSVELGEIIFDLGPWLLDDWVF